MVAAKCLDWNFDQTAVFRSAEQSLAPGAARQRHFRGERRQFFGRIGQAANADGESEVTARIGAGHFDPDHGVHRRR